MATRFELHVRHQVKGFLQTILMIDDEAFRRETEATLPTDENWDEVEDASIGSPLKLIPPSGSVEGDELDVQEVSRSFAEEALACAILSPQSLQENEDFRPAFVGTAKRADALILDWNLNSDNGTTAEKLIKAVLHNDTKLPRRRLRLLTVYTGEPDLTQIAERVAKATTESLGEDELKWDDDRRVAFSRGPLRVAVFAKEHVRSISTELADRRRAISDLPSLVVEEFSRHSLGLVTAASLAALSGIRNDAHRLLAALGPEIDAAVLGQRVSLPHPEDVERQVEGLIASELAAIVQDHEVGSHVGLPRIREWLTHKTRLGERGISTFESMDAELRLQLLADGFSSETKAKLKDAGISKSKQGKLVTEATHLFVETLEEKQISDQLFSMRMSLRSRYAKPSPVLQLGTIVEQDGLYAVCVQPLCDSVRIDGSRMFPLLPLEIVSEGDRIQSDLTVRDSNNPGGYVRLRLVPKPSRILMRDFKSGPSGTVQGRRYREVDRFSEVKVKGRGKSWRWVGDLKADHAQRMVERLSSEFSRVGLEEAESLRQGW
ncbi:response regulator receiver domain [Pseudoclavibacter sp. CFCC 13611]|uniref:response regulator receiver domain n=1 Tax=Pseudoclavibacter sp. CFCC 13611 TaxID=2615178 RepID=UPI0013012810|nr:response regulator receiver domain [Pseudoclavibacter sp. CFCC 13611]KAB1663356.1 hypothetical protein F8O08_06265 [Pseudoclavibacter sp. CFCC 13611]